MKLTKVRGWERATMTEPREMHVSDTTLAQLKLIEVDAPCQSCNGDNGRARIVRRGLRLCLICSRLDGIAQRQARAARAREDQ
jgi:hypothetical protein